MAWFKRSKTAGSVANKNTSVGHDAPWVRAEQAHDNTYLRLGAQVANWRMFAFFCLLLAGLGVGGMIYIGSKSKFIPLLVEVDKLGRTIAVRALTGDDAITDPGRLVYREVFDLIENLRTVSTDRADNNSRLDKGYLHLVGAAKTYVNAELNKAKPNDVGATKTVQVQVKTALKLTDKSWQVEWEEHSFSLNGEAMGVENWKATLQYVLTPSGEEADIRKDPIGFTVPEINWMKVI